MITEKGIFNSRNIKIYAKGKLVGQGRSGTSIVTDAINLLPNESTNILVISEGEMNTVDTGDNRTFGFILRHINVTQKVK